MDITQRTLNKEGALTADALPASAERQQQLGEVYAFLLYLARKKREASGTEIGAVLAETERTGPTIG